MNTYKLTIASPDGNLFKGEAAGFLVRGTEGDLAILAGHIPFVTAVKPCDCKLPLTDGTERIGHTEGGLLTTGVEETIFLSGSFSWKEEEK